jgi:hypothetical protein
VAPFCLEASGVRNVEAEPCDTNVDVVHALSS